VPQRFDIIDLETLSLRPGEGRQIDARVRIDPVSLAGQRYEVPGGTIDARLDVSRTLSGYALRLRFEAPLEGACMRCMSDASRGVPVDAREVDQPGGGEELTSPYISDGELDLAAWARDALSLTLPAQIACREDCAGLCPQCGVNLNAEPQHAHEREPDPRWAKLSELRFD
jgi:uncharacterized protein